MGEIEYETLRLTIIVDNSIVEVFANGRFALTARLYPMQSDSTNVLYWADTQRFWMKHISIYELRDTAFERRRTSKPNAVDLESNFEF